MIIIQRAMALLAIMASVALPVYAQDISPECAMDPTEVTLSYGETLTCAIEAAGDSDIYKFAGNIGDRVMIEAERVGGFLGAFICQQLIAPNGDTLFNTCADVQTPRLDVVLSQAGMHTVVVNEAGDDNGRITYSLSITCIGPLCDDTIPKPPVLIGVTPDPFTLNGGIFRVAVSPQDQDGNFITGDFGIENFRFENISIASASNPDTPVTSGNAEVTNVEIIEGPSDEPLTLVFAVDSTSSLQDNDPNRLRVDAGKALVNILTEQDRAAITDFAFTFPDGTNPLPDDSLRVSRVLQDFTSDKTLLQNAMDLVLDSGGGTPLYGAVLDGLDVLAQDAGPNPALVILTDGQNTREEFTLSEAIARAHELAMPVFPVGLGPELDFTDLQALARETGGMFVEATTAEDLTPNLEALSIGITEGRVEVSGEGVFNPPLQQAGTYQVSGVLMTSLEGGTAETPFTFTVEIPAP